MDWFEPRSQTTDSGVDFYELDVDEAFVNATSRESSHFVYAYRSDCEQCPLERLMGLQAGAFKLLKLSTNYPWKFRVLNEDVGNYSMANSSFIVCETEKQFGEFGLYEFRVDDCRIDTRVDPVNIFFPLNLVGLVFVISLVLLNIVPKITQFVMERKKSKQLEMNPEMAAQEQSPSDTQKNRIVSLDAFRGISILLMIFVNDGAGGYSILGHATWDGLRLADVVFPWFVWIMGVCIPISVKSQLKRNVHRLQIIRVVFKRSCILFALGVMLNTVTGFTLENLRIFGVLQRFGILYFLEAGLCALLWPRNYEQDGVVQDLTISVPQWLIHLIFHAIHICVVFFLPVPGCPTGYLGPGGYIENGRYFNCTGGATGYIDQLVIGQDHMYQYHAITFVYGAAPFEPEGFYGSLPSLLTVMLGVQAGIIMIVHSHWKARIIRLLVWGIACLLAAYAMFASDFIPVNKSLWSSSFSLVTSGMSFFLLSICYVLIDVLHWWSGSPFAYAGMNATIMYVGHIVTFQMWPWHWFWIGSKTHFLLLVENIWGVGLWAFIAYKLYQRKFFLSI